MIHCYLQSGKLYKEGIQLKDFQPIEESLRENSDLLQAIPVQAMILLLDKWGKAISVNKDILKREGSAYLTFFLKKNNIEKLIQSSLGDIKYLEEFVDQGSGRLVKAQGRGIVCHWIAGNIKTLAVYSMLQCAIGRNSNLLRIPRDNIQEVLDLISLFMDISIEFENKKYSSMDMIKNISLVCFDSQDTLLNTKMSLMADARVIWGGQEAVNSISRLPRKTTCRDVVFGPKYSFGVMDKTVAALTNETDGSTTLHKYINSFANDMVQFDQNACSSPHVLFVEGSLEQAKKIGEMLARTLEKAMVKYPNIVGEVKASKILNERGLYELSLDKHCFASKDMSYTILMDGELCLKEPLSGRCIYIKYINDIFQIEKLVTKRIQTIGLASLDRERSVKFAHRMTQKGAERITAFGSMNIYDYPWDGTYLLREAVRWCSLNI